MPPRSTSPANPPPGNPWTQLSDAAPFVLRDDAPLISRFNASRPDREDPYYVHLEVPPSPFTGSLSAPVVLLGLNPGFGPHHITEFANSEYRRAVLANIRQEPLPHPFMELDPRFEGSTAGHRWWARKAGALIRAAGLEAVTANLLVIEWFPYHSVKFKEMSSTLPSQQFGFQVVQEAIKRNALVVAMRSWRRWESTLPELTGYSNYFQLKNPQNPTLSPGNCPPGGFNRLLDRIARH